MKNETTLPTGNDTCKLVNAQTLLETLFDERSRPSLRSLRTWTSNRVIPYRWADFLRSRSGPGSTHEAHDQPALMLIRGCTQEEHTCSKQRTCFISVPMKRKGKQGRGYVPGEHKSNFLRAWCGKALPMPPYRAEPNEIRQFVIHVCCDSRLSRQIRLYTAGELVEMAVRTIKWNTGENAQRQMRNICRQLGIQLRKAAAGRPRKT